MGLLTQNHKNAIVEKAVENDSAEKILVYRRRNMGKFEFQQCSNIEGLYLIQPTVRGDARGYFMETYNYNDFKEAGLDMVFVHTIMRL